MDNSPIFMVKNFFDYEKIIPPPINLSKNLKSLYVTDSIQNVNLAKSLGWNYTFLYDKDLNIIDKFERRKLSSAYHCIVLNTTKFMAEDMKDPARALTILGERSFGKNNIPSKEISS